MKRLEIGVCGCTKRCPGIKREGPKLQTVELAPYLVKYIVSHGKSRRYTYLRFQSDMTLKVVVPRGRAVDAEAEIRERRAWVIKQLEAISKAKKILDDSRVMFDGKYLRIIFELDLEREEVLPDTDEGVIIIRATEPSRIREMVRRWFLRETSRYVVKRLSEISNQFPKYQSADVREIRNWGYCTRMGRISFSWQLIALPERLREYVVLHELTHLSVFNHSKEFRRRLAAVCPEYKKLEKELDQITAVSGYPNRTL